MVLVVGFFYVVGANALKVEFGEFLGNGVKGLYVRKSVREYSCELYCNWSVFRKVYYLKIANVF
jgi:hypothetical protein